ncbi:hypothetical protein SDC9_154953 [bioreactor metagenome]|uniref:Uncharacterized protein n=1 Tax=bioreactor metagenome TaxID=1076179 RepID=A0A645F2F0_9ZZZZ
MNPIIGVNNSSIFLSHPIIIPKALPREIDIAKAIINLLAVINIFTKISFVVNMSINALNTSFMLGTIIGEYIFDINSHNIKINIMDINLYLFCTIIEFFIWNITSNCAWIKFK